MPEPIEAEMIPDASPDFRKALLARLRDIVPEAFADGELDVNRLAELTGSANDAAAERYGLTWPGKREAIAMLQAPSRATLIPDPDESVNFNEAQHVFIEGENLEVLKLLYRSYFGQVKLIYIDPPYNTGGDFVYSDNFADPLGSYLRETGQINDEGGLLTSKPDRAGRWHSKWLSMMYPRLALARQLLCDEGVMFVSIDDHEMNTLRFLLDEVFGEENFVATFIWKRKAGGGDDSEHVASEHEYILCVARDSSKTSLASVLHESPSMTAKYNRNENGRRYYFERLDKTSLTYSPSMDFEIECPDGTFIRPPQPDADNPTTAWRWGSTTVKERRDELTFLKDKGGEWRVYTKTWEPVGGVTPRTLLTEKEHGRNRDGTQELADLLKPKVFNNPKPTKLLAKIIEIAASEKNELCLDFFAGSGSFAHAIIAANSADGGSRRTISVQYPEITGRTDYPTIADITRHRIRAVLQRIPDTAGSGLRAFRLAPSNLRRWSGIAEQSAEAYKTQLEAFTDSLECGWKRENVIWEVALREGLGLTAKVERVGENAAVFFRVSDEEREKAFTICLEDSLTLDSVKALGLQKDDLFVCRASALVDTMSANLALQCRLKVL